MKKIIFTVLFCLIFSAVTPLFAQRISPEKESEFYYVNVAVERIFPYRSGYVVLYRVGANRMARVYLPYEWFSEAAGRGEVVTLPRGNNWPSMSVFYRDGEFSHVRLFIHWWKGHPTWGNLPLNVNLNEHFADVESIDLEF